MSNKVLIGAILVTALSYSTGWAQEERVLCTGNITNNSMLVHVFQN